ncbi:MAG: quinoprotein dehydrogenase-associated SoxYZ-like carrier [Oceanospirillaceae bacterium]|nr:quinoprotein dehydrogenase-associated SoxYZ-like carrier [Oceanospirillaceae bacterium]
MWDYLRTRFLGDDRYRFDDRVRVELPPFAEDPTQVPVTVDASALAQPVSRIILWADLNPIQHIATLHPLDDRVAPSLSLRIKVQQATAVRAAVLAADGVWYLGGRFIDAAGGGCTAPSLAVADPYWESHLGEMQARLFSPYQPQGPGRARFRIIHPMDTGLVDGIPEFYIEQARLEDANGTPLMRLELSPPVSENPMLSFDTRGVDALRLWLRDNNGNSFAARVNGEGG